MGPISTHFWGPALIFSYQTFIQRKRGKTQKRERRRERTTGNSREREKAGICKSAINGVSGGELKRHEVNSLGIRHADIQ